MSFSHINTRLVVFFSAELARKLELARNLVGTVFTPPPSPPGAVRLVVMGELLSATGFQANDLYVHVLFDVPAGWVWCGTGALSSFSQISRTTHYGDDDDTAKFAFPFYGEFECDSGAAADAAWPVVYFQVNSLDSWERHRVEVGTGQFTIYLSFSF